MRLISKFKDYYDGLQDPTDKHHVYVRMPAHLKPDDPVSSALRVFNLHVPEDFQWAHDRLLGQDEADRVAREWHGAIVPKLAMKSVYGMSPPTQKDVSFTSEFVLFCGKLYRGVRYTERWEHLQGRDTTTWRQDDGLVTRVWWDAESFVADTVVKTRSGAELPDHKRKEIKTFMDEAFTVKESKAIMDLHFTTGCPVLTIDWDPSEKDRYRRQLVGLMNPRLADIQFYRVMPAPLVFQELSMFIGGVLSNNDRPEPVDNKYKILAHGFDLKDSFRKGPTKVHN